MSLRQRTLLLTGAALVALVGIMYIIAVRVLVSGYARAEHREAEKRTTEVVHLLKQRLEAFDALCHDWASWDDTCAFIAGKDPNYPETNLTLSAMKIPRANWVAYVDLQGRLVYGRWYDIERETIGPVPDDLRPLQAPGSFLLNHPDLQKGHVGLLNSREGILIVAARPVLTTKEKGPARGTFIFGRRLDKADTHEIEEATGLTISLQPCSTDHITAHLPPGPAEQLAGGGVTTQVEGENSIGGYAMLPGVAGPPAALLRVGDEREIFHHGRRTVEAMLVPTIVLGTVIGLLILIVLERQVLSRVAQLSADVAAVGACGDPAARVTLAGSDELSHLAICINESLEALERSRNQLAEREEQYRVLVETTPDWIWQVDENGIYTYASPKVRDTLGYPPEEILGKTPFDLMPPEEAARLGEVFAAIAAHREPFARLENTCRHADGRLIVAETSGVPIFDAAGQFRGYRGVDRDITERRDAQIELADEKERLRVTLRSIGDAVIATDTADRVSLMNRVAERLTGWPEAEALGRPIDEILRFVHPDTREPLPPPVGSMTTGQRRAHTLLLARDGAECLIAWSAAPIFGVGQQSMGAVLVFRDVTTENHLREEANKAQRLESVGLLAGGIAHDFNNLLTVIQSGVQMAQLLATDPERQQRVLTSALAACVRAAGLTQRLLTFAKGGAPVKQVCALDTLMRETVEFALAGSTVQLDLQVDPELRLVEVDPGQISQVIQNLVVNAVHAMPNGGTIHVTMENCAPSWAEDGRTLTGPEVSIAIRDEGVGISPADLPRIFDPYYTTKDHGTGLGLTSAYSIVSQHDGRISVSSQVGVGSTFTVHLPCAPDHAVAAAGRKQRSELACGSGRVLLMDDEDSVREMALLLLRKAGYDVEVTSHGGAAVAAYLRATREGHPFDLVILDLTVRGGMGGAETVQHLREINPDVKAIVCSGYSADPVMRQYRDYGFRACVGKPFDVQELALTVQRVLTASPDARAAEDASPANGPPELA